MANCLHDNFHSWRWSQSGLSTAEGGVTPGQFPSPLQGHNCHFVASTTTVVLKSVDVAKQKAFSLFM